MATRTIVRSQVRGFAVVWTTITILIGIATFFAIFLAYNTDSESSNNASLPQTDPPAVAIIPTSNATAVPTLELSPTPLPSPTTEVQEVAMVEDVEAQNAAEEEANTEDTGDTNARENDTVEEVSAQAEETPEVLPPMAQTDFRVGIQVQNSIDLNPDVQRAWMNDVRNLGMVTFKQQIRWNEIEQEPGVYDWAKLDLVMPIAEEYGFDVVGSIVAAPDWAREAGADLSQDGPPDDIQDFANFLTAMLERYPNQFFALEIWNEPNLEREWASPNGLSIEGFVDMQRVAYETIKNIEPGLIVISGALSPTGGYVTPEGVVTAIDDFDYMDQTIELGLLNYTDCVGAHHNGYNAPPTFLWNEMPDDPDAEFRGPFDNPHHSWSFRSTLETYANKIQVAGGDQRLCVTEFGWASVEDMDGFPEGFSFALDNTLEEQAEWTIDAIELMQEDDLVWIATIWNLNYGPQAGWSTDSDNTPYSFIGPEFSKRPVYQAVAEWHANQQE